MKYVFSVIEVPTFRPSLNFIRLLRVVITPSVRGENDSKQSDEIQDNSDPPFKQIAGPKGWIWHPFFLNEMKVALFLFCVARCF